MTAVAKRTKTEFFEAIYAKFVAAGNPKKTTSADIGSWAIRNNEWDLEPKKKLAEFQKEWKGAVSRETTEAPSGHRQRRWISFKRNVIDPDTGKKTQKDLWCRFEDATPDEFGDSIKSRYDGAEADINSANQDVDAYNANYLPKGQKPIQKRLYTWVNDK